MASQGLWSKLTGKKRDAEAAQRWEAFASWAAENGLTLLQIERVYQTARRGTKAHVYKFGTTWRRDGWFWWTRVIPGSVVAVVVSQGWGPHTNKSDVLFVGGEHSGHGIEGTFDRKSLARARRHWRRNGT